MPKIIVEIKEDGNVIVYATFPAELEVVDIAYIKKEATDGATDYAYRSTTPAAEVAKAEKHLDAVTTGMIVL